MILKTQSAPLSLQHLDTTDVVKTELLHLSVLQIMQLQTYGQVRGSQRVQPHWCSTLQLPKHLGVSGVLLLLCSCSGLFGLC